MADPVIITASIIEGLLRSDGIGPSTPIAERAKRCFREAYSDSGFLIFREDDKFRAGIGALILLSEGEERERIEQEIRMLRGLNAAIEGLPIDMAALVPDGFTAIGLMQLFRDRDKPAEGADG